MPDCCRRCGIGVGAGRAYCRDCFTFVNPRVVDGPRVDATVLANRRRVAAYYRANRELVLLKARAYRARRSEVSG